MNPAIQAAKAFATAAHQGQRRKGARGEPYIDHVAEVAGLVARFGGSDLAVTAAWLHDTVEDCGALPEDLQEAFGADVAAVVAELTDDKAQPKARRKELQIVNAPGKSPSAALVKICDKLSNVRAVEVSPAAHWPASRQADYLDWADAVVRLLPAGADPARATFAAQLAQSRAAVLRRARTGQ